MNFLSKIAPFLSSALGLAGPWGALAGSVLKAATGAKSGDSTDIELALSKATPDQIAAIKKAEEDFQVQMKALDIKSVDDLEQMANEDRANARNREIQVRDHTPEFLASMITFGFFGTLWWVFVHGVAPTVHDLAMTMVGTLGTAWIGVCSYYFGSSRNADKNSQTLSDIAKQP